MHTTARRKAAALLILFGLLAASFPVVAAPGRIAEKPEVQPLLGAVAAWLETVWPDFGTAAEPRSAWAPLGPQADPDGEPQATSGDPSPKTELGANLDPDG